MSVRELMLNGVIQSLVADKGFGFIKPAAGGADVFFHFSAVDAPFASLTQGQKVEYELDTKSEKPRAQSVVTGEGGQPVGPTRPQTGQADSRGPRSSGPGRGGSRQGGPRSGGPRSGGPRSGGKPRFGGSASRDTRRSADQPDVEHGFVTKLHRKKFRGFISSVKHGPEFLFTAQDVVGDKRYSQLQIGDFVQFTKGTPDPDDPKQPIAKFVKVVEREVKSPMIGRLRRHPNARKKKPDWR